MESTTELCRFEGPEGGIEMPLGKKLNIRAFPSKPINACGRSNVIRLEMDWGSLMPAVEPGRTQSKIKKTQHKRLRRAADEDGKILVDDGEGEEAM
ncbi:hypothetical protein ACLOJK_032414 [Asimina triloba]